MKKIFFFLLLAITIQSVSAQKKLITLEDIWVKNTFKQDFVAGFRSMQDGLHYTEINANRTLVKMRFSDASFVDSILSFKGLNYEGKELAIDDYQFSPDESKILLLTESENIYRRSVLNKVYVYDLKTKSMVRVHDKKILHASFSPQGDKLAYVLDNNLYYCDLESMEHTAITEDGDFNRLNGNCDWVYEEEFEFTKAFEWSPQGDYIAFYSFDQTAVSEYSFAVYDKLYPTDYKYKYPKAGEKNSDVEIKMYFLQNGKTRTCELGNEKDIYIPRIKMNPFDNSLIIFRMNRLQNHLELLRADEKGNTEVVFEEKSETYVEINDNWHFLKSKNGFVYTSEMSGYTHIHSYDLDQRTNQQLTKGSWDVTEIQGVDEANGMVWYMSAESSPMERQLYTIRLDGNDKKCQTPERGWHSIQFGAGYAYYLDRFSTTSKVPVYTLYGPDRKGRMLKDNHVLKTKMDEYSISPLELITVPSATGENLNAWIIKPADFNPSKKYPLFMFQYSGPGSQQVTNQFSGRDFWWYQMLAQQGYIILCVDGTGTGYRGEAFKKKTYLQLGKYESDDQIAVARHFAKQSYIDSTRIGIWGWSYGGYMSSICLLKGSDVFKMAIAVAPVTNWRYYDNIYTERYMRTPQENAKGYDDNSPVNMVNQLKGKYLLIHGTADDNVHYQNAIEMQKALIQANKDFDSEAYPNKNHGISGGVTRLHLYRRMTKFILENL